jgi:peptide subunit release factor RF-3
MALITLPLGLDQQEGWGTVTLPSSMAIFFHGVFSLIPAYTEAYKQQEK